MNPDQIKRRETWGIFALITGALFSLGATLMWLLNTQLMIFVGSIGVAIAVMGILTLVTIPDVITQEDF